MAKAKWTERKVEELHSIIDSGSTDGVKSFIELGGFDGLPPCLSRDSCYHEGGFNRKRAMESCIGNCDDAMLSLLMDLGLPESLDKWDGIDYKSVLWGDSEGYAWKEACDKAKAGITRGDDDAVSKPIEFLRFLVSHGYANRRKTGWAKLKELVLVWLPEDEAFLEELLAAGLDIADLSGDELLWAELIRRNRLATMSFAKSHGFKLLEDRNRVILQPGSPVAALDHALGLGIPIKYVDVGCDDDLLAAAAARGLRPACVYPRGRSSLSPWDQDIVMQGMSELIGAGKLDVIKRFLENGVTEVDIQDARSVGNQEIVKLLEFYGLDAVSSVVYDCEKYFDANTKEIVLPEGVERVDKDACRRLHEVSALRLPSTLVEIGDRAFADMEWVGEGPARATVPKGVAELGYGAFYGFDEITVYDTVNPHAKLSIDSTNGSASGTVGWLGIRLKDGYVPATSNAVCSDFEVVVRSSETGDVKFKVWMPCVSAKSSKVRNTYASAWGPNATFAFDEADKLFDDLPNRKTKGRVAINRLRWPVNLRDEDRAKMEAFVSECPRDVVKALCDADDVEGVEFAAGRGCIDRKNVKALLAYAEDGNRAPGCAAYIRRYSDERLGGAPASPKKKAPSVSAQLNDARTKLLEGDASVLEGLRSRSMKSVAPNDAVELLELAAKHADSDAVRLLYDLFGEFEFQSGALASAIARADLAMAQVIAEHGADLTCSVTDVGARGDTPEKRERRAAKHYASRDRIYVSLIVDAGIADAGLGKVEGKLPDVVGALHERGNLGDDDLKLICLAAAEQGKFQIAERLVGLGADESAGGSMVVTRWWNRKPKNVEISVYGDLVWCGCNPGTARFISDVCPDALAGKWEKTFLEGIPETVSTLIMCLDEGSFVGSRGKLVKILAAGGCEDGLRHVSGWSGCFTEKNLAAAIDAASSNGHADVVAYLMDEKSRRYGETKGNGLES